MRWTHTFLLAAVVGLALSGSAWGKIPDKPGPPKRPSAMIVYGSYIAAGVLVAAACIGAFKSSKRTHQD